MSPVSIVARLILSIWCRYEQRHSPRLELLAHLGDCVIKNTPGIICTFPDQLDFPGSGRKTQILRLKAHHLLGNLVINWTAFLASSRQSLYSDLSGIHGTVLL